jgi:hypothetical protein
MPVYHCNSAADDCGKVYMSDFRNRPVQVFDREVIVLGSVVGSRRSGQGLLCPRSTHVLELQLYGINEESVEIYAHP